MSSTEVEIESDRSAAKSPSAVVDPFQAASFDDRGGSFGRRRAWGAVLLLTLIGVVNLVDRSLPAVLVEPIKHDLRLSDTAFGLINGFGFLVVYSLLGIPIARLSDRGIYGLVISACLSFWSVMTLLGSAAQAGWQLALTRMGVAMGEAGNTPASHAFIARNFSQTSRGAPLAVLTLSIPVATLLSHLIGGLLGEALGWRMTFAIMASAGLLLAPVVLVTLGPRQAAVGPASSTSPALSLRPALQLLRKQSFLIIVTATAFIGIGGYALATFSGAFLMRVHGMSLGEMGVKYGLAAGGAGAVSVLIAGVAADRLSARDPRWILWVLALMIAALLPCSYAAFLVPNAWAALVLMALANILGTAYLAPVVAAVQRIAPQESRATASALLLMFTALAGGLGPFIAGQISDALQPQLGANSLRPAMLVVPIAHTIAGLLYFVASFTFRRDLVEESAPVRPT